ncbi:uncharacterized protein RSE6_08589 [Rhynchosporium secalis]|uniref:Uncharacterized protein n=1 Tax=Rhynchosporium secalis TaxID=38038 RepID=A0A1E1MFT4_RHYSE|nr:uncharacterized protein RSE6_08589 [Rhynchosporium secalis]
MKDYVAKPLIGPGQLFLSYSLAINACRPVPEGWKTANSRWSKISASRGYLKIKSRRDSRGKVKNGQVDVGLATRRDTTYAKEKDKASLDTRERTGPLASGSLFHSPKTFETANLISSRSIIRDWSEVPLYTAIEFRGTSQIRSDRQDKLPNGFLMQTLPHRRPATLTGAWLLL